MRQKLTHIRTTYCVYTPAKKVWAAGATPRFRAGAALVIHLAMVLFLEIGVVVNRSIINHSELVDARA